MGAGVDTCIWACGLLFLAFWGFMAGIGIVPSNWDLGRSIYKGAGSRAANRKQNLSTTFSHFKIRIFDKYTSNSTSNPRDVWSLSFFSFG